MAKMWAHLNAEPPSVREQRPDVPQALDDVIRARWPSARPTAPRRRSSARQRCAAVGETALAPSSSRARRS